MTVALSWLALSLSQYPKIFYLLKINSFCSFKICLLNYFIANLILTTNVDKVMTSYLQSTAIKCGIALIRQIIFFRCHIE